MPLLPLGWPQTYLYPPLLTLILWAGLTAGMLRLNRLGPRAGRLGLWLSLPLLAGAHYTLWLVRDDASAAGAYLAFTAGMLIWAWHELAFYSGVLSGPWRAECPPGARGLRRFRYALATHLYHELAFVGELLLLGWLLGGGHNHLGALTILLSWALQHSAKLNVLLGVRSLQVDLFPPHLRYLGSFWACRPASAFFLPAVSVATMLAVMLWMAAAAHSPEPLAVRLALLGSLVSLGAVEHWLLVLAPARQTEAVGSTPGS